MPQAEGNAQETAVVETPVVEQKSTPEVKPDAQKTPAHVAGKPDVMSDRERGLLAETQKERKARQDLEKRVEELSTNYERERKRMKLLVSDNPQSEDEEAADQIRQQFAKVFPGLAKLTDEQIDRVLKASESAGSAEEVVNHHWQQHAQRTVANVVEGIAEAAGVDKFSDRQTRRIETLFTQFVDSDKANLARYIKGDETLIQEFIDSYTEDFVTPAKRQITNAEITRFRPVPRGGDRNVRATPPKKIDYSDPKAVEDAMVSSFKEHGGSFKR